METRCPICFDEDLSANDLLRCFHRVHLKCIDKCVNKICPICRTPLNIENIPSYNPVYYELCGDNVIYNGKKYVQIDGEDELCDDSDSDEI
jgi:hypothetical protein